MKTTKRFLLPLLLLGSLTLVAPAQGAYTIGMGDQNPGIFQNQLFKDLRTKKVRYIVAWDALSDPQQRTEVTTYMAAARAARQEVLVNFSAKRGCFVNGRYSRTSACRAPSVSRFRAAFRAFRTAFPYVRTYGIWNEANSPSQPTLRNPRRVGQYFNAVRTSCRGCKLLIASLLDTSTLRSYATRLRRAAPRARIYGLHNYGDVNRRRTTGTRTLLRTVPGEVWITESGGLVRFEGSNIRPRPSLRQAVSSLRNMFSLAARYDTRTRGNRSRITRLYQYNFQEQAGARFDAALVNPDGSARPSYTYFKSKIRRLRK